MDINAEPDDINANDDWDYNDFANAKVESSGTAEAKTRPKFDLNAIGNNSFGDDDDLL